MTRFQGRSRAFGSVVTRKVVPCEAAEEDGGKQERRREVGNEAGKTGELVSR